MSILFPPFKSSAPLQAGLYYARKRTRDLRIAAMNSTAMTPVTTLDPTTLGAHTTLSNTITVSDGVTQFLQGDASNSTSISTSGPSVLVAMVSTSDGSFKTVTGIQDTTGLNWQRRSGAQVVDAAGSFVNTEVWWAPSPAALNGNSVTVTLSSSTNAGEFGVFAVFGCKDISSPWDTNPALPAVATSNTGNSVPTVTGVSTTAAGTAIFEFIDNGTQSGPAASAGAGFTSAVSNLDGPASGDKLAVVTAAYELVGTAQSKISVAGGNTINDGWLIIADAMVAAGNNVVATHDTTTTDSGAFSTTSQSSGKHYMEVTVNSQDNGENSGFGVTVAGTSFAAFGGGGGIGGAAIYDSGNVFVNGTNMGNGGIGGSPTGDGSVTGILLDLTNKLITFSNAKTNTLGTPFALPSSGPFFFCLDDDGSGGSLTANFAGPFVGTLPTGYSAWDS
jgi:hypothetical protein